MATSQTLECPKKLVGRLIGRGGETITAMQRHSGARIQIDQNVPEGQPCRVEITGTQLAVDLAAYLIKDCMEGGTARDASTMAATAQMMQGYLQMQRAQQQQGQVPGMGGGFPPGPQGGQPGGMPSANPQQPGGGQPQMGQPQQQQQNPQGAGL
eukprot:RCo040522